MVGGRVGNKKSFTDLNGIQCLVLFSLFFGWVVLFLLLNRWISVLLLLLLLSFTECAHTHTRSTADCNICIQRKSVQCFFHLFPSDIVPFSWRKRDNLLHTKREKVTMRRREKSDRKSNNNNNSKNSKKRWKECAVHVWKRTLRIRFWLRCKNLAQEPKAK